MICTCDLDVGGGLDGGLAWAGMAALPLLLRRPSRHGRLVVVVLRCSQPAHRLSLPLRPNPPLSPTVCTVPPRPDLHHRNCAHPRGRTFTPSYLHRTISLAPGSPKLHPPTDRRNHPPRLCHRHPLYRIHVDRPRKPALAIYALVHCCRHAKVAIQPNPEYD